MTALQTAIGKVLEQLAELFAAKALKQRQIAAGLRACGNPESALYASTKASAFEEAEREVRDLIRTWNPP